MKDLYYLSLYVYERLVKFASRYSLKLLLLIAMFQQRTALLLVL